MRKSIIISLLAGGGAAAAAGIAAVIGYCRRRKTCGGCGCCKNDEPIREEFTRDELRAEIQECNESLDELRKIHEEKSRELEELSSYVSQLTARSEVLSAAGEAYDAACRRAEERGDKDFNPTIYIESRKIDREGSD